MSNLPIPPPHEPFVSTDGRVSEVWYRYLESGSRGLGAASSVVDGITTYAATLLATTSADTARTVLAAEPATTIASWTPEFLLNGATAGSSYGIAQFGLYAKSGQRVTLWGTLGLTTFSATTGPLTIKGVPFPSANVAGLRHGGSVGSYVGTPALPLVRMTTNTTVITLFMENGSSGAVVVPSSGLVTPVVLEFQIDYLTTQTTA